MLLSPMLENHLTKRLTGLQNAGQEQLLHRCRKGLEKETLRVSLAGDIARTPHPPALGSALTNPYITTDYSEALLEFITPPFTDIRETLRFLGDIHRFVYDRIDDELLWATSMPCVVARGEQGIPIARYGSSNIGTMKHVYRRGLGYRYGKVMQVISGIHFNFSMADEFWPVFQSIEDNNQTLQDFISESYLRLIRNQQRFGWLVLYLFGASPAICKSFMAGRETHLAEFDASTYYGPFATSLRMSDIGYSNKIDAKCSLRVSYNNLDEYIDTLTQAIETPCRDYADIGVKVDGEYRQLNANILQIENEYYSTMRPKQIPHKGEKPTRALRRRGVQYVELRSVDINPFEPTGINETQMRFLEAFLIFCLLHDSPTIDADEREEINYNQITTAVQGRDPAIRLRRNEKALSLKTWALELCDKMQGICELLDGKRPGRPYTKALELQRELILDVEKTPSARVLAEMRETGEAFFHFAKRISLGHQSYFKNLPLNVERMRFLSEEAEASLKRQADIEASDDVSFDDFLRRYFSS